MGISRRVLLQRIGAAAAGAAVVPSLADAAVVPSGPIGLDRNENPYGASPKALAAMQEAARTALHRYPGAEIDALRDAIARHHRVSADRIVLGCGSSEILRMAADAFAGPGKALITGQPTFELIGECARRAGADVIRCPLTHEYAHDLAAMLARAGSSTGLVYVCNPNNPTGTLTSRRDIEMFVRALPATTYVVIDEAYHQYVGSPADHASFADRPIDDERVIVTRSFSTIFGLAALRVGYAVAAPRTARLLAACGLPDGVSAVAARAAAAAIDDAEHVRESTMRNVDDRQEFANQCHARNLRPIDSVANFVMMDVGVPAAGLIEHFRQNNVSIAPPIPWFERHIRVSLGTRAEMSEFWRVWDLGPARAGH